LIRGLDQHAAIPLVLYSTHITPAVAATALEWGASACIRKPSLIDELDRSLQNFFRNAFPGNVGSCLI
jgi:hypothetical protein